MSTPDANSKKPNIWEIEEEPLYDSHHREPHGLFLDAVAPQVYSEEMQYDMATYAATQMFTPEEELAMHEDLEQEQWDEPYSDVDTDLGTDQEFDELAQAVNSDLAIY
jgi:hypothetical protein